MSKKSKRKASKNGTWALCITAGLVLGLGMAPLVGGFLISVVLGAAAGALAGYFFTR